MRWPFSLLFRGDRDAPAAADGPAGGVGTPAGEPARVAAPPPRPAAWKGLAPVQRTVAEAPLTAPAGAFARDLASRRPLDPILRPLAHDVAADGPAGLVSGIASPLVMPATAAAAHPEAAVLPVGTGAVQRRPRTTSVARDPLAGPAAAESGREAGAEAGAEASALPAPRIRELPVAGTAVAGLAATRVAGPTAPEPARPHARTTTQRTASTTAPVEADPGDQAAPTPAGSGRAGSPPDGVPAAPGAPPAGPADGETPAVQRRTLGESRRLGLGAPLARRPEPRGTSPAPALPLARSTGPGTPPARVASAAPAQLPVLRLAVAPPTTAPTTSAAPLPDAPAPSAGAGPGGDGDAAGNGDVAGTIPGMAPPRPLLGDPARRAAPAAGDEAGRTEGAGSLEADAGLLPLVARLATDAPTSSPGSAEPGGRRHGGSGPGAVTSVPVAGLPPATAPLVAARPTVDARPSLSSSVAPATPPRPAVVVARRTAHLAVVPAATRSGAAGDPGAGHVAAGPPGASAADLALGPAPSPASLQRSVADAGPVGSSGGAARPSRADSLGPSGAVPLAEARPGASAWHAGATPATSGPSPGAPAGPAGRGERLDLALPVVARLAAGMVSDAPAPGTALGWTPDGGFAPVPAAVGPVVQRVVEVGEMTAQVEPGSSSGGAGPAAGVGSGGPDYEEIAEHVYDRIRSRIALELLLDRERMGLLIDG